MDTFTYMSVFISRKKQAAARLAQMSCKNVIAKAENGKGIELQVLNAKDVKNKQTKGKKNIYSGVRNSSTRYVY